MALIYDKPSPSYKSGHRVMCSHLMSTLDGYEGQQELIEFGKTIGLKPSWLQKKDTPYEHFDLMGSKIFAAGAAGAHEVPGRELVEVIRRRKNA